MRPLTESVPKCLLEIQGIPFLDIQIDWLVKTGVTELVLSTGHLGEKVGEHLEKSPPKGVEVTWIREPKALGTGGALRYLFKQGLLHDRFLVTYGDSLLPVDFGRVMEYFRRCLKPALLTVYRNEGRWDASNVWYEDGRLIRYDKSQESIPEIHRTHIDYGLMGFSRDILATMPVEVPSDLAALLTALSIAGNLEGLEVRNRFYEMGSSEGFHELNELWKRSDFRGGLDLGLPGF